MCVCLYIAKVKDRNTAEFKAPAALSSVRQNPHNNNTMSLDLPDLEDFAALTITPAREGEKKVLGAGESLNINRRIMVADDKIEDACRMRWPAADHERAVLTRLANRTEPMPWKEFYETMEEAQTMWAVGGKPRQLLFQMQAPVAVEGGKRRGDGSGYSVTSVCANEFYAFVLRRKMVEIVGEDGKVESKPEDTAPVLAISVLSNLEETVWENTEIEIAKFSVGAAYFDQLFIVDDFTLLAVNVLLHTV